ncbi:hypothetical protein JCM9140_1611 [Halalkalibacter wakoensis JCM 9140]|uniref:Activator of Hsp90 ATPase homologue 1/2-like C-terminal domain-containing protein n=1 Tax=Halalkalibacter wakoensis JCM 9140 TaxID=1236970 RepID=W4Q0Y8_9BACI|nr:SRPBCC domain-containing protein [Halalkalibacter wakoensis]GAE25605.1 hypothetical protein JCM9140_1611 [Halalkalibacter wakoensis JCM 9140]
MKTIQDIKQTLVLDASIEDVWEKVATANGIASWFMDNDFEAIKGHEFHLQSPFGPSPCKVLEIEKPNHIVFSWDQDGWVVEFKLVKEDEHQTSFTLVHRGWKENDQMVEKANEKSSVIRERMNQGWIGILQKLKEVVEK